MTTSISIALATCNGSRHLAALLDSLAAQTQLPGELVAFDDASTDDTVAILQAFAATAPFAVRIFRNPQRLGVTGNFSRAIADCRCESIALADQDDVWRSDKLARLAAALTPPSVPAAFSDADVVDAELVSLDYTMWQRVRLTPGELERLENGQGFAVLLKHHIVTGATLAFKSVLRDAALPIPPDWPHDAWLALVAAAQGQLVPLRQALVSYRQHDGNVVGGRRKSLRHQFRDALNVDRSRWYREELARWHALAVRLEQCAAPGGLRTTLAGKIAHLEARSQLPTRRWRRLPGILDELRRGGYARYARNWGSIALDLLVK